MNNTISMMMDSGMMDNYMDGMMMCSHMDDMVMPESMDTKNLNINYFLVQGFRIQ